MYGFVLQVETQNNQLKAAIPAHPAPELGGDASTSWGNNIGRPAIEFEFSMLRTDEFPCINHNDFIFEHYPWDNCEIGMQGLSD